MYKKFGSIFISLAATVVVVVGAVSLYKKISYMSVVTYVPAAVHSLFTQPVPEPTVTLTFGGDIMLDRGVLRSVQKNFAGDYSKLFVGTTDFLHQDDITFINLEGPVSTKGHKVGSMYSFEMDPAVIPIIKNAGIDIVGFANNHVGDYSKAAFVDTMANLNAAALPFAGAGTNHAAAASPTIIEKNGIKVGYLAFTDVGPNWLPAKGDNDTAGNPTPDSSAGILLASDPHFSELVSSAKTKVDVLVVAFHWGVEYKPHTDRQATLAHTAIDAGADIVAGGHPHVAQDIETYKNKLIIYSLGNFIFDQYFSKETMQGLVVRTTVTKDGTISNTTEYIHHLDKNYAIASITEKYPKPKTSDISASVTIGWVGDIPPSQTAPLFDETILPALQQPDIMAGNLEGALGSKTISKCGEGEAHCYSFIGSELFAQTLSASGFDILNIANNHALDNGESGLAITQNILTQHHIAFSGPKNPTPTVITKNGIDVAFLSFGHNAWTANMQDTATVTETVRAAAAKYSIVVVLFHGGAEGIEKTHVIKSNEIYIGENRGNEYAFAHSAVDAGADLVLGSGPHVVRGIETYKAKTIAYSAGNFLTTEGMNNSSLLGKGALMTFTLNQNGDVQSRTITSTVSDPKNTVSLDLANEAANLIYALTSEDFNQTID